MAFTKLEPTGVNTSATFTFANISVTGNITSSGVSNLGPVGNVHITGGSSGQVLSTDGSGTLSWVAQTGGGSSYSNANVAAYLPTYAGNFTAGNISTTGNITAAYFIGNGSQLTGLPASYSNTNVAEYLPTYTGNVSANYFTGNGSLLTSLTGANVTGTVSSATTAATVTTAAQPNITSTGSLASLTVTGLITATAGGIKVGNLQDTSGTNTIQLLNSNVSVTGNIVAGTGGTGNVTATYFVGNGSTLTSLTGGNVTGQVANALVAGTVYTAAQPNITSVGTLSSVSVTSNVTAGNIKTDNLLYSNGVAWSFGGGGGGGANIANGTSNVNIAASGGNITAGVGGVGNIFVITSTGANVNGYLAVTGSFTAGTGSGGSIAGANAVTANYFVGSGAYITGISSLSSGTSNVNIGSANANVTIGVGGTGNVAIFANTGANINGNLSISGTLSAGGGSGGSITGANAITANYFSGKRYAETVVSGGTTSGTLTPDVSQGTIFQYTLNGAITINALGNAVAGTSATLILTQDATGSRTLTSTMKFAGASKTLTTAANSIDIMSVFYDGTTYYAALSKGYA